MRYNPLTPSTMLRRATVTFLCLILIGIGVGYHYLRPLTVKAQATVSGDFMASLPKTTLITDRNGEVLYYYYKDINRIIAPADKLPNSLKKAVVAAEDERFYLHDGFDVVSVVRALVANMENGYIVSGGSTLTMQIVKNITGDDRRDWQRKAKEAYLATLLEQRYTKEELLALYLNIVPLGGNIAGAEAASQLYFDKPASDLALHESATIAALITSPSFYINDRDALTKRRNYVLDRMVATNKITKNEAEVAKKVAVAIKDPAIPYKAQHFTTHVLDQLKREYKDDLATKGFVVKTTLDVKTQQLAEKSIQDNRGVLTANSADTAGIVVMDPKTGDVLAMVGSADYFNEKNQGQVNVTTAPLSYGSTLKPIIFSLLLEKDNWSPGAIMWDVKTDFPIVGQRKPYSPNDYDRKFFGPMTVREALGTSRNVTAVKALQMVGLDNTLKRLEDFGVTSLGTDTKNYGPSLAIGGGGIPLLQMTGTYTALANSGKVSPAQTILEIRNSVGDVVKKYEPKTKEVLKPEVAYEVADILQDNNARKRVFGANSQLIIPGKTVAAKTGTAEDYRSALTIGFTPDVVVGVIVANNNNAPLRAGAGGAMAAAPFFNTFMTHYLADKPNNWFARPETVKEQRFQTVIGSINDLVAPWQSPTDRFNKRIAEVDDPLWNRAVASTGRKTDDNKKNIATQPETTTVRAVVQPAPESSPQEQSAPEEGQNQEQGREGNGNEENRGRGRDQEG